MSVLALVLKELREHAGMAVGGLWLASCLLLVWVGDAFDERSIPLLRPVGGALQLIGPFLAMLAASRLVVRERQQATHEFLAGLPVSAGQREAVKWGLGQGYVAGSLLVLLLGSAFVVQRQEVITWAWLVTLSLQTVCWSVWCWSVAWSTAQAGQVRWWVGVSVVGTMIVLQPEGGPIDCLGHPFDHHRFAPPWGAMGWALGWSAGLVTVAGTAALWQGGSLVAAAWSTTSTGLSWLGRFVAGVVLVGVLVVTDDDVPRGWDLLPAVLEGEEGLVVRVAATPGSTRWALAEQVSKELGALPLADMVEVEVVLLGEGGAGVDLDLAEQVVLLDVADDAEVDEVVRRAWRLVLANHAGSWLSWDPERCWLAPGAADALLGLEPVVERRAAWAAGQVREEQLARFRSVQLAVGDDVADAVAAVGMQVLADEVGPEALLDFLREALPEVRDDDDARQLRSEPLDAVLERTTGLSGPAHRRAWRARLDALRSEHAEWVDPVVVPDARLARTDGGIAWSLDTPSNGAVHLVWSELDPLHSEVLPGQSQRVRALEGREGELFVAANPGRRLAVAVAVDALGGSVRGPWRVLP